MNELEDLYDTIGICRDRQKLEMCINNLQRGYDFAETLLSDSISPIHQLVNNTEAKDKLQRVSLHVSDEISQ